MIYMLIQRPGAAIGLSIRVMFVDCHHSVNLLHWYCQIPCVGNLAIASLLTLLMDHMSPREVADKLVVGMYFHMVHAQSIFIFSNSHTLEIRHFPISPLIMFAEVVLVNLNPIYYIYFPLGAEIALCELLKKILIFQRVL